MARPDIDCAGSHRNCDRASAPHPLVRLHGKHPRSNSSGLPGMCVVAGDTSTMKVRRRQARLMTKLEDWYCGKLFSRCPSGGLIGHYVAKALARVR